MSNVNENAENNNNRQELVISMDNETSDKIHTTMYPSQKSSNDISPTAPMQVAAAAPHRRHSSHFNHRPHFQVFTYE